MASQRMKTLSRSHSPPYHPAAQSIHASPAQRARHTQYPVAASHRPCPAQRPEGLVGHRQKRLQKKKKNKTKQNKQKQTNKNCATMVPLSPYNNINISRMQRKGRRIHLSGSCFKNIVIDYFVLLDKTENQSNPLCLLNSKPPKSNISSYAIHICIRSSK
jgi:hypothetical protein